MKAYIRGNYFYLESNDRIYEGLAKDVLIKRLTPTSDEFHFKNLNNWTGEGISINDLEDESGNAYTVSSFITFYEEGTGKSNGGGNGTGLQAYDTTNSFKKDEVVIKDYKIFIANDDIPENTPFATGTTGATWRELSASNFWQATNSETTDDYVFKGGLNGTNWQINRYTNPVIGQALRATENNNNSYTTLADAWVDRAILNYI